MNTLESIASIHVGTLVHNRAAGARGGKTAAARAATPQALRTVNAAKVKLIVVGDTGSSWFSVVPKSDWISTGPIT